MNYAELKTSIAAFLNRRDLTDVIPTFIQLVESDFNRTVRHRDMIARATSDLDAQFTGLPDDFLESKNVQLNSDPVTSLEYLSPEVADHYRVYYQTGKPQWYTMIGDQIEVVPVPDGTYTIELVYYQKIPSLSDETTSNWILENHLDAYLYGALMHSAPYLKNDERIAIWGQMYKAAIADMNASSDKAEYSGSLLKMRVR